MCYFLAINAREMDDSVLINDNANDGDNQRIGTVILPSAVPSSSNISNNNNNSNNNNSNSTTRDEPAVHAYMQLDWPHRLVLQELPQSDRFATVGAFERVSRHLRHLGGDTVNLKKEVWDKQKNERTFGHFSASESQRR